MKNDLRSILFVATVVLAFSICGLAQKTGEYKPIDKTDVGANTAADFAVKTKSTEMKKKVSLGEIVKAESEDLEGMNRNFRLCMKVIEDSKPASVQAVVSIDQYTNFKLISWAYSTCGTKGNGFKPIDNGDIGAGFAADFAVKEQSKMTKPAITLREIVRAEDREPKLGARDFRLCMKVTAFGKPSSVQAIVSMDQYSNLKLVSWTDSKCGEPSHDGFSEVDKSHAGIGLAADFAVKKHSEETKIKHTLAGILKGETKGMFEMTYRVCMKVAEDGETQTIQAVVTMDQYSNMKLVSWKHSDCGN